MNEQVATRHVGHVGPILQWNIPRPGETLAGGYVVERICGRGPLAVVLSAVHPRLGETVAVKVLRPEWAGNAPAIERFLREAGAARRIESEHFARVLDAGTLESGAPYVLLEQVPGESLQDILAKWQPLPISTVVDWVAQACEAIGEAHLHGIVHGELNPSNLVLSGQQNTNGKPPFIKVIDFGLSRTPPAATPGLSSRLIGDAGIVGAAYDKAPEQLRASYEADPRTDVWALGAVLYELLSGEPPFSGRTLPQVCAAVLTEAPRSLQSLRAEIPPELELVVARCLKKEREARWASVSDLARALAPFGSTAAHASVARLERLVAARPDTGPRSSVSSVTPASSSDFLPSSSGLRLSPDSLPTEDYAPPRRGAASARVVLVSLLMLSGVGAIAFLGMYGTVHGSPVHLGGPIGVTAAQATADRPAMALDPPVIPPPPPAAAVGVGPDTSPAQSPAPSPAPSLAPLQTERTANDVANGGATKNGSAGAAAGEPVGALQGPPRPTRAVHPAPVPRPAQRRAVVVHVAPRPTPPPTSAVGAAAGGAASESPGRGPDAVTGTPAAAASTAPPAGVAHETSKTESNPYDQPDPPAPPHATPPGDPLESQK